MLIQQQDEETTYILDDSGEQFSEYENNNQILPKKEKDEDDGLLGRCCRCSRRQMIVLVLLSLSSLSIAQSTSLFPPFYPRIAEEKGTSASVYGMVLGSNCLVMFLVTPFVGKHLTTIGIKFALASGMLVDGVCCISSGFLDQMAAGPIFISMSIIIRIFHALGHAAVITSSFTIMAIEFPKSVGKIYGLTRTLLNLGFLIGPIIGGTLYQLDGYRLPFLVIGSFQCFAALLSLLLHPKYDQFVYQGKEERANPVSISKILSIPSIWISFGCFVVSTLTNGFLSVTLEPHILRQYSLPPICMGLLFGVKDGVSGLSSPFWGWVCGKTKVLKLLVALCALMSGCSLLLVNPPPFIIFNPSLWFIIVALTLNGFGNSGEQVVAAVDSMRKTIEQSSDPDDPSTHGFIAGLWSSLSALGRFLSRSLSGILVDHLGHRGVTMLVSGLNILLALVALAYLCFRFARERRCQQKTDSSFDFTASCEYQRSQTYVAATL